MPEALPSQTPGLPKRLLFVANVAWFFAMHRLPLALMARERGFDVHIACGLGSGAEDLLAHNFQLHPLALPREAFTPLADLRATAQMVALYRRLRPDIVHHVTLKPILYGSAAARIAGVPAVVNAFAGLGYAFSGTSQFARMRSRAIMRALRMSLPYVGHVVLFENEDDRQLLVSNGAVRAAEAQVIAGVGVDTSIYHVTPEPPGPCNVLFASRMLREKGAEYFVDAARRMRAAGSTVQFTMVGMPDSTNPGSLSEAQLREWHEQGVIRWLGFRRDMPDVIATSHIVCLPTYYREGVPRILLEAAACGRPLIATDMPGCRDIVRPGETGLLVPPRDVERLVGAIETLAKSPDMRAAMALAARRLAVDRFEVGIVKKRTWDLYQGLLKSAPK